MAKGPTHEQIEPLEPVARQIGRKLKVSGESLERVGLQGGPLWNYSSKSMKETAKDLVKLASELVKLSNDMKKLGL